MGFEQIVNNLTFKRMSTLRKNIQSVVDYVFKQLSLDAYNLTQILTLIEGIKLL